MSTNRINWWNNAVEKAAGGRLMRETEQDAYRDFINSRLGGALGVGGVSDTGARKTGSRVGRKPARIPPDVRAVTAQRSVPTKKLGYELTDQGARRLVCAVVEQAVLDYKLLVKRKRIVAGKVVPRRHSKCSWVRETEGYAAELVYFFQPHGPMDQCLAAAAININPNQIREKLGIVV